MAADVVVFRRWTRTRAGGVLEYVALHYVAQCCFHSIRSPSVIRGLHICVLRETFANWCRISGLSKPCKMPLVTSSILSAQVADNELPRGVDKLPGRE
mmetsp:Transcript_5035/g.18816  ORF Transcript_5035/g.18816 Transcript_5035/m.18816 type:complete len:98 (-) Transcript_5035:198-491(-)